MITMEFQGSQIAFLRSRLTLIRGPRDSSCQYFTIELDT